MGGSSQTSSVGADAASSAQPSPSTWLTLSHAPATTMMTTTSISSSHLIYPSLSPSSATASSTGIASDASSLDSQLSHGRPSLSTGAIVGCVVGGVIGLGLVILACLFCLRRKGIQVLSSLGMNSRRKSDDSLTTLHAMRDSEAFPMGAVLAPRAANMVPSHATTPRPVVAEPVKQEPTPDTWGLAQKFHAKHGALSARCSVTPLIQVQPCSRAPSTLSHLSSQQSAETKLDYMEQAEFGTAPSATSDYESVDDPEKSVMMVDFSNFPEDNRLAPRRDYDMRLSTRSDPFDLELPLKSLGCHARPFQQGPETGHF
ncbi:hypothetical protein PDE_04112 [Penicillium oxalicum 114-2]|uniref:Uncharacterized protein n=1 Tax=Penicillium oxalicum (strain 114-2 / CGMCC 5302) TaxID=933388 RepID=S8AST9_PENO1|nr:hypothetical protein PDE_04112 [Penicillium oxalicum 114-2]